MNNWILEQSGKEITKIDQLPNHEALVGFVYKITNMKNGRIYIGQKSLYNVRKKKVTKTEKRLTGTRNNSIV